MRNFVRSHAVAVHYVLAVLIALTVVVLQIVLTRRNPDLANVLTDLWKWMDVHRTYPNLVTIARFAADGHEIVFLILVFGAAPSIAAIIVAYVAYGLQGLATLLARFKPWATRADRPRALVAYLIILAGFFAGVALSLYLVVLEGKPSDYALALDSFGGSLLTLIPFALAGAFIDDGGTLEELGWRGFVLPQLQSKLRSPLVATVILAVLWWSWHLPREIPGIVPGETLRAFAIRQTVFFFLILSLAVVATYFVNLTGGSVLPAIMIHGGTNVWSKGITEHGVHSLFFPSMDVRTLTAYALGIVVLCVAGPRLGLRPAEAG